MKTFYSLLISVFLIFAFANNSTAQQILIKQFEKTFGGVGDDGLSNMQQTADGGYILSGVTSSFGAGGTDIFVYRCPITFDELHGIICFSQGHLQGMEKFRS